MLHSRRSLLKYSAGLGSLLLANSVEGGWGKRAYASSKLTMQLDWIFNVQFAGLFVAEKEGLYAERGLEVDIKPYERGMVVTDQVASMPFLVGCAEQNLILDAQAKGQPIKALASMFQASPLGLMSLPSNPVEKIEDLVGKRIGLDIDGVKVMKLVESVSSIDPGSIEIVDVDYSTKTEKLLGGECDAVQCYTIDEPIALEQEIGQTPKIFKFGEHGYQAYAQVIFASEATLQQNEAMIADFLEATFMGWEMALQDISGSAQLVVDNYAEDADLAYQQKSLELIAEFVKPKGSQTIGLISEEQWSQMANLMADHNIIEEVPDLETTLSLGLWSGAV